jgi:hypothetical protein
MSNTIIVKNHYGTISEAIDGIILSVEENDYALTQREESRLKSIAKPPIGESAFERIMVRRSDGGKVDHEMIVEFRNTGKGYMVQSNVHIPDVTMKSYRDLSNNKDVHRQVSMNINNYILENFDNLKSSVRCDIAELADLFERRKIDSAIKKLMEQKSNSDYINILSIVNSHYDLTSNRQIMMSEEKREEYDTTSNRSFLNQEIPLDIKEYQEFVDFVNNNNLEMINENFISNITGKLKSKISFIKDLATKLAMNIGELIEIFKNKNVFSLFQGMKWSLKVLFDNIKRGFDIYNKIIAIIPDFYAESKMGKWTTEGLAKLDVFLSKHPYIKKVTGMALAALLVYIWFNMTFTGDPRYDFGMAALLAAIYGSYSLHEILGGTEGPKLLMLFATGLIGISFPWPGAGSILFIMGIIGTLAYYNRVKIKNAAIEAWKNYRRIKNKPIRGINPSALMAALKRNRSVSGGAAANRGRLATESFDYRMSNDNSRKLKKKRVRISS